MSWSAVAAGTPREVKESLASQFNNAKQQAIPNFETEGKEVELAERITNIALDEMIESGQPLVRVAGYGSALVKWEGNKVVNGINTQFSLTINPLQVLE
jgi:hypothetical protein